MHLNLSKEELDNEVWKVVPDYPNYEVSDMGRVRSNCVKAGDKKRMLKQTITNKGYCQVDLWNTSGKKTYIVHRLVMIAFVGKCKSGYEVCHKDDLSKVDNRLLSLRYGTREDNLREQHGKSLGSKTVINIRNDYRNGLTMKQIRVKYKMRSIQHVSRTLTGSLWGKVEGALTKQEMKDIAYKRKQSKKSQLTF